jgi:hypothetical protein
VRKHKISLVQTLALALWLAAPVIAAGALHIAAIRLDVLPAMARIPIDGGLTFRSRRIFGANKTLRGVLLMVFFTILAAIVQAWLAEHVDWARAMTPRELLAAGPLAWGALLGLGYVIGELPNSFFKRQIDIAPGAPGAGVLGPVFWIIDQVDSLAGALIAMSVIWLPPWPVVAAMLLVTLVVHPLAAAGMVALGLKTRVG